MAFVALEFLWVHLHGGAALLGCALVSYLLLQSLVQLARNDNRLQQKRTVILLLITLFCMCFAFLQPPNGFHVLDYVSALQNDKTISFIAEWQPRAFGLYLSELWPFIVLSFVALAIGKRHWVFNGLLLCSMLYLSRDAFRHEVLFVFAAIATCFYQFDRSQFIDGLGKRLLLRPLTVTLVSTFCILALAHSATVRSFGFERQDNLFGFGQFDFAKGAYDFIEKENITGNMFNTYGIGGYLMYRGYPHRKIFMDGRNVDYGFDFLAHAYAAGLSVDRWDELVDKYNITYAVVDYDAIKLADKLPYSSILDVHPNWALVYLDDWTAVYLKKIPANESLMQRLRYTSVHASSLQYDNAFASASDAERTAISMELRRMQASSSKSIKATMGLAKIALREKRDEDAKMLANSARAVRPYDPEPLAIIAAIEVNNSEWKEAAQTYEDLLELAGDNYPDLNYGFIAEVFQKAGRPLQAWYYRLGQRNLLPSQQESSTSSKATGVAVSPAADALEFSDQGIVLVDEGKLDEAEELFLTSLKINPGSAEAWNNLCAVRVSLKRYKDAIEACKRAIAVEKEFGDAHYNLALAYFNSKNMQQARTQATLAVKFGRKTEGEELLYLINKESR